MPTVFIPAPLRELTGGVTQLEIEAASVREVVEQLDARFPGVKARLCDGDELATALQVSIDDQISSRGLATKLRSDSEVHFLPAIGGG